jgi:hypothetical protein
MSQSYGSPISIASQCGFLFANFAQVNPQAVIVDRTLRYYCAEKEVLRLTFPASSSSCSSEVAYNNPHWSAALSDHPDVRLQIEKGGQGYDLAQNIALAGTDAAPGISNCHRATTLSLAFKCGLSPTVAQFHVWLYEDNQTARPVEVWQVSFLP